MKNFLSFIFLLIIILGVIGYFLPTQYTINKSIVISSSSADIHQYVGDLQKWGLWMPRKGEDPDIVINNSEKTIGIGASQSWQNKHGGGSLTFTSWSPDNGIEYDLYLQAGKYKCKSAIRYNTTSETRTRVMWSMQGDMNMLIIGGYFALFMQYSIGSMFQQGLDQLKLIVEQDK